MASTSPADGVSRLAKDAFYVSVGFGMIAVQKAQVRRREVRKQLEDRWKTVEERVSSLVSSRAA